MYDSFWVTQTHLQGLTDCLRVTVKTVTSKAVKGKAVPLQSWSGPEGSRKLRFPYFVTTTQDSGKVGSGRLYPRETHLVLISIRG